MAAAQSDKDIEAGSGATGSSASSGAAPAGAAAGAVTGTDAAGHAPASATASAASRHAARRAAKAAAKAAKRGTANVPDEVQQTVAQAAVAYDRNATKLWGTIALALLVAIGGFYVYGLLEEQDNEAAAALAEGIEVARAQIVKEGEEPFDEDAETFPSAEARAKKAQQTFASTAKKFEGKLAARWAQLGEANALAQLGKHTEAEKAFAKLSSDADPFIAARATEGVAFALEAQGKHADAAARYEALAKLQDGAFKPVGDYHRARMLIAQNKQREAATLLESLVKAERGKPDTAGVRFESVVADAETLLTELSITLDDPKLRAEIPKSRSTSSGGGSNEDLMNQLRLQLGQGEGSGAQGGLSPELLKALQQQLGDQAPAAPAPSAPSPSPAQ